MYVVHNEIYLVYLMYMSQVSYGNLLNSMVNCHCILRNPVQQAVECIYSVCRLPAVSLQVINDDLPYWGYEIKLFEVPEHRGGQTKPL